MRVILHQDIADQTLSLNFYENKNDIDDLKINLNCGIIYVRAHDFTKKELIKLKNMIDRELKEIE